MSASWKTKGDVAVEDSGGVRAVSIRGNFHRDLDPADRDALADSLKGGGGAERLIVDLSDLVRIDSWGEEQVADVVEDVVRAGGRVAVVTDANRPYLLRSLLELLRENGDSVLFCHEVAMARAWVVEAAP